MGSSTARCVGHGLAAGFVIALLVASCGGASPAWSGNGGPEGGLAGGADGANGGPPSAPMPDGASSPGLIVGDSSRVLGESDVAVSPPDDGGPLGCPLYTKLCSGACIPVTVDPQNCGDCGKTCASSEICSAGTCVPASRGCIPAPQGGDPALTVCGQACVDTLNDSNNCGASTGRAACGHKCAPAEGCVNGACVPKLPVGTTPPAACGECFSDVARSTFRWALCSCGDVTLQQQLVTDAYDSTLGPYPPNPLQVGGGFGVDGNFSGGGGAVNIGGALWCSGPGGVTTASNATVSQEVHVSGGLNSTGGTLTIRDNTWVGGNVGGNVAIGKALTVSPTSTIAGGVRAASTVRQSFTVAPPCDCSDTALLGQSIDQIVQAHAAGNDNAVISLSAGALATPAATAIRLDLPCGRYYLTGINQPGTSVTIFAHGRTSLFIQGDVVGATVSFVLDPTAEFDTFITGTVRTSGQFIVGSPNYPALSRTYVGGSAPIDLLGEAGRTAGNLYMGKTPLNVSSHLVLYGGLVVASLANQENIEIHYDRAVLTIPKCGPPPPMCKSCNDCGNDPCVDGMCTPSCSSSAQCCAPLLCINGKCQINGNPQ